MFSPSVTASQSVLPEEKIAEIENEVAPEPIKKTFKEKVIDEFGEGHIMVEVSRCESGWRQFDETGAPLRGKVNNKDVGGFQINEFYHKETSVKLGMDIETEDGNIAYARYIYDQSGTTPWNWSRPCWGNAI